MKILLSVCLIVAIALGVAYVGGVFDVETKVIVNAEVKDDVAEFTYDTLNEAQESTDKVFDALKRKLKESESDGE